MEKKVLLLWLVVGAGVVWGQNTTHDYLNSSLIRLAQIQSINNATVWPNNISSCSSALNERQTVSTAHETISPATTQRAQVDGVEVQSVTEQSKLSKLPVVFGDEVLLFSHDEIPNKQVSQFGCITGEVEIIEKCYPSFADELRQGKVTLEEIKSRNPYRFDIRGQGEELTQRRSFEFHHDQLARQDVGLTIFDGYHNSANTDSYATEIVFFPREQVPSYQVGKNGIEVTLANGEKIIFDKQSGKITGGVLSESKIQVGKAGVFQYSGKNIMIQTTGLDGHSRSYMNSAKKAIITKEGKKCEVPFEKLWERPNDSKAPHFKFSTDESFYKWLDQHSGCFKK